ncbi:MAG: hypothetical protein KJ906_00045 [Nanoarchaeota archaeon]|nr:hypothetical protein [Nanoarchaeota archaeon]
MLLFIYLIFSIIACGLIFYKYNKGKYLIYILSAFITGLLGLFVEEIGILRGDWAWPETFISILNTPLEMVLLYVLMGFATAVLTIYFKDYFNPNPQKQEKSSKYVFLFALLTLLTAFVYVLDTALFIFFLFLGVALFLKYRNPIIIIAGALGAAIDVIFDTLLLLLGGYTGYNIVIPYKDFFIIGVLIAGLALYLNEKIK